MYQAGRKQVPGREANGMRNTNAKYAHKCKGSFSNQTNPNRVCDRERVGHGVEAQVIKGDYHKMCFAQAQGSPTKLIKLKLNKHDNFCLESIW